MRQETPEVRRYRLHRGIWNAMRQRCTMPSHGAYKNYGGRGIKVCDRWLESFDNFIADMGWRPEGKFDLDRIDNNGNYEPGNCRWTTRSVNLTNRRGRSIDPASETKRLETLKRVAPVAGARKRDTNAQSAGYLDYDDMQRVFVSYAKQGKDAAAIAKEMGVSYWTSRSMMGKRDFRCA